jgi:ABC-type polysaccharide/polyol phosphate transport system ATPase subunit
VEKRTLVEVDHISKRFARELRKSLIYAVKDIARDWMGGEHAAQNLRTGEFWALDQVSFSLFEGEIVAMVGSNGSGKTTLMRLLSGIYKPDAGAIRFHGIQNVTSLFALNVGLNPLFTGMENIYLKAALYGMDRRQLEQKLPFIIEFSELRDKLKTPVGNYSSGMKARLSYSVAIATEPDLFIIDEALAVGDSMFRAKCYDHLKAYVQQPNKSIIYVTNRINKVKSLAERVLVLDQGALVMDTYDVPMGLDFYYNNCLKNLNPRERELKLRRIHEYD